jgi:hypothetical protein
VVTPASTSMVRLARSTSRILSILARQRTMQSGTGKLPPLRPVPEPRVTTGVLELEASFRMDAICSLELAKTTQPGICCNAAVPSNEYGIRSSASVKTFVGPTIDLSCVRTSSESRTANYHRNKAGKTKTFWPWPFWWFRGKNWLQQAHQTSSLSAVCPMV